MSCIPKSLHQVASLEVERCRLVAILCQLFSICTPCYQANFYLRFIAEYHSIPVTIYRQVPLSSTPSCPVSLVNLPNPNHLTNNTAMVACFEQHSLHSTFRHSSVSVLIKFCRDFFQRCRSVIFNGSDQWTFVSSWHQLRSPTSMMTSKKHILILYKLVYYVQVSTGHNICIYTVSR